MLIGKTQAPAIQKQKIEFMFHCLKARILRFVVQIFDECFTESSSIEKVGFKADWMQAIQGINYFRKQIIKNDQKVDIKQLNSILTDVNRAFILFCCSMVNLSIYRQVSTPGL